MAEDNILDLMKICPCVFDKDMMISLLLDFQLLDKQMGNFETMATQLDDPVNMAQAIVMDTMMRKLSQLMDRLVGYGMQTFVVNQETWETGTWVEEIENWCLDPAREVGDSAIIENAYGKTLCYISQKENIE